MLNETLRSSACVRGSGITIPVLPRLLTNTLNVLQNPPEDLAIVCLDEAEQGIEETYVVVAHCLVCGAAKCLADVYALNLMQNAL